jgi:rhodanese-related sulfurtransferase
MIARHLEDPMPTNVKDLLSAANASVTKLSPSDAAEKMHGDNVLIVDVRDPSEVEKTGKIKGALNVSRGMLEFRADADSPYHNPAFQKDRTVLVYCASGGRSALAGKTLKDMGFGTVYNIGGFKDLVDAGQETESA